MKIECKNCGRYLGEFGGGFTIVLCKCQHFNILETGKETKLVLKNFLNLKSYNDKIEKYMATAQSEQ